nr:uncharacterized protein LOC109734452 [Aegilops tauschii subsp. strangulata]
MTGSWALVGWLLLLLGLSGKASLTRTRGFLRRLAPSPLHTPRPHLSDAAPPSLYSTPRPRPSTAAPRSLCSAVPILALPSPNLDEIGRICRISRDIQPQLLVGHAGRTNELLVGIRPTAPLKMAPNPLDSACLLLAARVQTATTSRRQAYYAKKQYRGMKQARRCARRPATALIVALTEHRGRLDRACRLSVDNWLCVDGDEPLVVASIAARDEPCVCAGDGALHLLSPLAIRE